MKKSEGFELVNLDSRVQHVVRLTYCPNPSSVMTFEDKFALYIQLSDVLILPGRIGLITCPTSDMLLNLRIRCSKETVCKNHKKTLLCLREISVDVPILPVSTPEAVRTKESLTTVGICHNRILGH